MEDPMGDRMKVYERAQSYQLMPLLPAFARLDGRAFHTFCKGLRKPYDARLSLIMQNVTVSLMESTGACVGYTQSDEITLAWVPPTFDSQIPFNGKIQKMASNMASEATLEFFRELPAHLPEKAELSPTFDCRVWNVPNLVEAANVFLWREFDATRNSVSSAARAKFSAKALHGQNRKSMLDMLNNAGVNWNDYPSAFKRGTYFKRIPTIVQIPEERQVEGGPTEVERKKITRMDFLPLSQMEDRTFTLFDTVY